MRNEPQSPRAGRSGNGSFLSSSLRAFLNNVSSNANTIASTVRSAGVAVSSTASQAGEDNLREQVQWAGFDLLGLGPTNFRHVLLLTYPNGYQVWDVEEADNVHELVSKRDGPIAFLRVQPQPQPHTHPTEPFERLLQASRPLLLVVTSEANNCSMNSVSSINAGGMGSLPTPGGNHFVPTVVRFYSMRSHGYVHLLRFRTAICAVRCSCRIVAVALLSQIYCFDAWTLKSTFSVPTYPSPQAALGGSTAAGYGAMALGSRWLAYAANQPFVANTGRVSPQHLTPSPGVSPSTSPATGGLLPHFAKESSKQVAVGIVTLADMGIKALSTYCSKIRHDAGTPPGSSSRSSIKNTCNGSNARNTESDYAGIVIVRDFVSNLVIAQFRAHSSPISALCFDPSGTLLVTASVNGQNFNVFRIMPSGNSTRQHFDSSVSHIQIYKLSRGLTNAVIQDISFSYDSHWIAISSSRGTNHLFAISPYGGAVGPHTHGAVPIDGTMPTLALPWWSSNGSVRSSQQAGALPPPAITLSVVNRIRNGSTGWRGTVSGAAAAATGRIMSSNGAIAVMFHDGGDKTTESEINKNTFKDQLWILSPSGHLLRYSLQPSAVFDGSHERNHVPGSEVSGLQDLHVAVEPLQRWDVGRRPNGLEYGGMNEIDAESFLHDQNEATPVRVVQSSGTEEVMSEEMHRWFLSNAELQTHQPRPPIWSKPEISFHAYVDPTIDSIGGEIELENCKARLVEVRKKDLVPVFKRFQKLNTVQDVRDLIIESSPTRIASTRMPMNKGKLHDGFTSTNVGLMQVQGPSNVIGFGPMDNSLAKQTRASIGFDDHQGMQSDFEASNISFYQKRMSPSASEKSFLQSGHISDGECSTPTTPNPSVNVIGSPPMDIPTHCVTSYPSPSRFDGFVDRAHDESPTCSIGLSMATTHLSVLLDTDHESIKTLKQHASPPQDSDLVGEDEISTDVNNKSEDFDGGERVEDGWDGGMFHFTEES